MADIRKLRLGELLIKAGKLDMESLNQALEMQKKSGKKLGDVLISEKFVSEDDILQVLEEQLGFEHVDLDNYAIDESIAIAIPENLVRRYHLIAISEKDDKVLVAMEDPLNIFAFDDIKLVLKRPVEAVISSRRSISNAIEKYYGKENAKKFLEEFEENFDATEVEIDEDVEASEVATAPIVKLLSTIIEQAVNSKASDIHIEPQADSVRVRYRVDGDLREVMNLNKNTQAGLTTRVKIIGRMNIAERRIPQDGRVEMKQNGKDIDMRISTLPTIYGEKTVIRILDQSGFNFSKQSIGFSPEDMKRFDSVLSQPFGILLVSGPTGSGKSTTLYSVLKEFNTENRNVVTVEDPVEYKLGGINQVHVNAKAGMTFAAGLRSILRQDPDVIMIGEIRDGETADIAIRAAITGHVVLSTIHTNDSPSTIARLTDMGVEKFMVSSALMGILSQRLVKKLCPSCKEAYVANDQEKRILGYRGEQPLKLFRPVGCPLCSKGYKGRTAVHELMVMNEAVRNVIDNGGNTDEIRKQALKDGMNTLLQAAAKLALSGVTSFDEVIRIGYTLG